MRKWRWPTIRPSDDRPLILIVDDEESFVSSLEYVLEAEGFKTMVAYDGDHALAAARESQPDVVLLDVMLPGLSGVEVCRRLKREQDTSVIMLTARGTDVDMVVGLDAGADDYVAKPFSLSVLLARIRAVIRRRGGHEDPLVTAGSLMLRPDSYTAELQGSPLALTPRLFQLLLLLAQHPGRVFSRDDILNRVWGYEFIGETRTVDVHIHWLREALGEASPMIETVRGVGYRLVVPT